MTSCLLCERGAHSWDDRECHCCGLLREDYDKCQAFGATPVAPPTRVEQFDTELATITQRRGSTYGHPLDTFGVAQQIKTAVRGCPDIECRNALEMIAEKMARLCATPDHVDGWVDIAGYARTALMVLDEREKRKTREKTD